MKPILEVCNLWKQYKIGIQKSSYLSIREKIHPKQWFTTKNHDTFWALKDINFNVYPGECLGIVGKNGAGKSTLLKILSKITPPTKGKINARGRIASLLEVGTGFHPELTGHENIYLNGSILGLKRSEIKLVYDEIIDFSGVEPFLGTPLKHYSSGMRLRLAFAVAAFLRPEILVIDEILTVGDAEFQKKCLGKMDNISKNGKTILFVSHNLGAVKQLCKKGILLDSGALKTIDKIDSVINLYSQQNNSSKKQYPANSIIKYLEVQQNEDIITIKAAYKYSFNKGIPSLGFVIYNNLGAPITGFNPTMFANNKSYTNNSNQGTIKIHIEQPKLIDGQYSISIWFGNGYEDFFNDEHCLKIDIKNMTNNKQLPSNLVGNVSPLCKYEFN